MSRKRAAYEALCWLAEVGDEDTLDYLEELVEEIARASVQKSQPVAAWAWAPPAERVFWLVLPTGGKVRL